MKFFTVRACVCFQWELVVTLRNAHSIQSTAHRLENLSRLPTASQGNHGTHLIKKLPLQSSKKSSDVHGDADFSIGGKKRT